MDDVERTPRATGIVIAPFNSSWTRIHSSVADALSQADVKIWWDRVDQMPGDSITGSLHKALEDADFVIADVTGENPNVMYEVGYAYGRSKPVLPIIERGQQSAPASLNGRLYFVYDKDNPKKFIEFLKKWLTPYLAHSLVGEPVG